jgi:putative spermidine/putrescine transport system substrate-binding protein
MGMSGEKAVSRPTTLFRHGIAAALACGAKGGIAALAAACAIAYAGARAEDTLSIVTWGGAYGEAQEIALFEPYAKETGTRIATEFYDGTLAKIRALIDGEQPVDVVDLSPAALGPLCADGLLETIDVSSLGPGASGERAEEDFFTGGLPTCGVASLAWSMAVAFDREAFPKGQPSRIADLLDVKKFPGKRALPNSPRYTLELALLADGVEPAEVYPALATPEGVERAFKALDKIKGEVYWWDSAQEPITWLLEKDVVMAAGYSGRLFRAAVGDRKRLGVIFDGQIYDLDLWAIPKNARNKDGAMRFISFATAPARLAAQAQLTAYGPMRKSAVDLVGKHPVIDVEMREFLPTAPDNFKKALKIDDAWWKTHSAELTKRFEEWWAAASSAGGKPPEPKIQEAAPAAPPPQAAP